MSQQNIHAWVDKFGRVMEIGQRVAATRGKSLHVGEILWFTPAGVTIASENEDGDVKNTPILYLTTGYSRLKGKNSFYIISERP